ncbi:MAG: M4 family metallopeptidase [Mesorhizobium sp.]|nr:MAG: M4 family metallopeptidase [Mesorhizobium sp.]
MAKGMKSMRLHRGEPSAGPALESLAGPDTFALGVEALDPESAARRYIDAVIGSAPHAIAAAPSMNNTAAEYKSLGVDRIPFTGNQHVKFRQHFHKIPVYGSLVSVELDGKNGFVSINTTVGDPTNVDPVAKLSPQSVLKKVARWAGYGDTPMGQPARLFFYYDAEQARWRLVYVVEDVLRLKPQIKAKQGGVTALPEVSDFVVDAHDGELVAELPRTQTMAETDRLENAVDGLGATRQIGIVLDNTLNSKQLRDRGRNVHTHNFGFKDAFFQQTSLPGALVGNPPDPWDAAAVSAHANAGAVVDFLRNILQRDGLDGVGGEIISTVNCVFQSSSASQEWRNAARFRGQMIYGQRQVNGTLRSYAVALDVVAHELLHGLTENTARLEYRFESGALNESYSDIFGIIVANSSVENVQDWNWEMGEDLTETGVPLRDMRDPTKFNQPAHMQDFVVLPNTPAGDNGGVHTNSGIHNKAAFNVFNAISAGGDVLFSPVEVARLYYITLVAHLSRTSSFNDCLAGLVLAAQSMFGNDETGQTKIDAIKAAYDAVGIVDPAAVA